MMDQEQLDIQFRERFKKNGLIVNEEALTRAIYDGLPSSRRSMRKPEEGAPSSEVEIQGRSQTRTTQVAGKRRAYKTGNGWGFRRGLVLGVVTLVALVALSFGVRALIDHLNWDQSLVVITDDSMSPGNVGPASANPSLTATPTGAKAELWKEIQRIREGVKSGTLVLEWPSAAVAAGDLPSDPVQLLDSLEQAVFSSDVTLYVVDDAGEASALQSEILGMSNVSKLVLVNKEDALEELKKKFEDKPEIFEGLATNPLPARLEVWLEDSGQSASFAERFRGRPEVDQVLYAHTDYAGLTGRLRGLTHSVGESETSTTWMTVSTSEAPSAPLPTNIGSTTAPRLNWGDVARLSGREVRVEKPVEKPQAMGTRLGSMVVYCLVTITNTGAETIDYAASDFMLEGNSSGSTGIATLDGTIDALPVLVRGTVSPGDSVTAAVCFSLSETDAPVKVQLGTRFSTEMVLASWR